MPQFDKRVDAYIAKSPEFAQPVLEYIRELVHEACPEIEETIKWGFPHFQYKGIVCSMASFKQHCSFGFWKGAVMDDPKKVLTVVGKTSMGNFNRITKTTDLPPKKILITYVKHAVNLNEDGVKVSKPSVRFKSTPLKVPASLQQHLSKNKKALTTFQSLSNSQRKDYVEWISEAKTEVTKTKRTDQAIVWLSEGKGRNWKYEKK